MGNTFKWKLEELIFVFHVVRLNPSKPLKDWLAENTKIAISQKYSPFRKAHMEGDTSAFVNQLEFDALKMTSNKTRNESVQYIADYLESCGVEKTEVFNRFETDKGGAFWWTDKTRSLTYACVIMKAPMSIRNEIANILDSNFENPFYQKGVILYNHSKDPKKNPLPKADLAFLESYGDMTKSEAIELVTAFLVENSEQADTLLKEYEILQDRDDYSKAIARWKSLMDRSYKRYLTELCLRYYFIDNSFDFNFIDPEDEKGKDDVAKENLKIVNENLFLPKEEDIKSPVDFFNNNSETIVEFYRTKTSIMAFNVVYEHWLSILKKGTPSERPYNILKKQFEAEFEKILPLQWFYKEFFGEDNKERCCRYCDISEKELLEMREAGLLNTKRLYVKGYSMEIDQLDAYKGYAKDNVALICYWCNNAKTDEYTDEEFREIGEAIARIWKKRRESLLKAVS